MFSCFHRVHGVHTLSSTHAIIIRLLFHSKQYPYIQPSFRNHSIIQCMLDLCRYLHTLYIHTFPPPDTNSTLIGRRRPSFGAWYKSQNVHTAYASTNTVTLRKLKLKLRTTLARLVLLIIFLLPTTGGEQLATN